MIYLTNVQGTQDKVLPLELNVDTVYIRDNIVQKFDEENNPYWQYNEKQLTFEEYLRLTIPDNEQAIVELSQLLSAYQEQMDKAIAELTILIGGTQNV